MFEELDKYGEVENLNVCDNVADHMVGNVYIKFRDEESAARCIAGLQVGFCFKGARADLSPATCGVCLNTHQLPRAGQFRAGWGQGGSACLTGRGAQSTAPSNKLCKLRKATAEVCVSVCCAAGAGPLLRRAPCQRRVLARHRLQGGDLQAV